MHVRAKLHWKPMMGGMVLAIMLLVASAPQAHASSLPLNLDQLVSGPVAAPILPSLPLHLPINIPLLSPLLVSPVPDPTIDLKVLVIAADGSEADLPAIRQALDILGTPYTVYVSSKTPGGLTADKLSSGHHAYYQGVILTTGNLAYNNGLAWVSGLSQTEWQTLWTYEATFGIRQISWYTYPTADYGFNAPNGAVDTTNNPITTHLTSAGQPLFPYVPANSPLSIQLAYTYLATPLADSYTSSVLVDGQGNALGAIRTYPSQGNRQNLALTFDSNPNLVHSLVLAYGLVNWATKGLFLGERHIYLGAQPDDIFIDDDIWSATRPCGSSVDNTGVTYRITATDLQAVTAWQQQKNTQSTTQQLRLSMPFNGVGTVVGNYAPDTLTPAATVDQSQFNWISHTYDHTNMDNMNYATATEEIQQNIDVARQYLFSNFSTANLITPDISGLTNSQVLQAAVDNGVQYVVTDTSQPGYNNPSPNAGIYNSYQPAILMIPRHPTNLYFNVTTPAEWTAEYNCMYASYWGRNLSYSEILDKESQMMLFYLLKGDMDPLMFHQPNLQAYDGVHTLLSDLLDATLAKYNGLFNLPILSPTMDQLGARMAARMQYNAAGVTASITIGANAGATGKTITLTAQQAVTVPVTGLQTWGAEMYGGQPISYIQLSAGQSVTLPLN